MTLHLEKRIIDKIEKSRTIAICMHNSPDGDCVGSAVALEMACKILGKNVDLIVHDKVPKRFAPIIGDKRVGKIVLPPQGKSYDLAILVDCADLNRTHDRIQQIAKCLIVIDHHPIIKSIGDIYLHQSVAATGIMILNLLKNIVTLTPEIANALYFAIASDTGGFKHSNTDSSVLKICSELVDYGADIQLITKIFETKTFSSIRLLGEVLPQIKYDKHYKFTYVYVTRDQIERCNSNYEEAAGLIEQIRDIDDADITMLFIEGYQNIRIRARSHNANVNQILQQFGGGGHDKAAGCAIQTTNLSRVIDEVVSYTKEFLDKN